MTNFSSILSAYINGEESTSVSLLDRGFAYGDGIFETIRVDWGVPHLWPYHKQRLLKGCKLLNIPFDESALLEEEIKALCQNHSDKERTILKIVISRGIGGRSYRPLSDIKPTRALWLMPAQPLPAIHYLEGVTVTVCRHRLPHNRPLAGIKHLNRLDQIIARSEWADQYFEGLMLDKDDYVIEGTMSNLFICQGGKLLLTPQLDECGVAGVMREHLLTISKQHSFKCQQTRLTLEQVLNAEGAFICNSVIGILPIRQIGDTMLRLPAMRESLQLLAATSEQ